MSVTRMRVNGLCGFPKTLITVTVLANDLHHPRLVYDTLPAGGLCD